MWVHSSENELQHNIVTSHIFVAFGCAYIYILLLVVVIVLILLLLLLLLLLINGCLQLITKC